MDKIYHKPHEPSRTREKKSSCCWCGSWLKPVLIIFVIFLYSIPIAAQASFPPELISQSAVIMDAATGTIIFYKNPDDEIPPASLTKLMSMHIVFKEIEEGRASLDEIIVPGRESWARNQPPLSSTMNLAPGQQLSIRELLLGMAVFSGNDAAAALALRFAPTVRDFTLMMNREAEAMGLSKTRFVDASGYSEDNMTTAREFAEFCKIYLETHPYSLRDYHSVREFAYPKAENVAEQYRDNPGTRVQRNRNTLLRRVEGVDGLKTGFIFESGYNIALTAERDGSRFIAVILGAPADWGGDRIRDDEGAILMDWAFDNYKTIKLSIEKPEPVRVWKGKTNFAEVNFGGAMEFTTLAERGENLRYGFEFIEPLLAPLPEASITGYLVLYDGLGELRRIPLLTTEETERGGFFKRLFDSIRLFFKRKK